MDDKKRQFFITILIGEIKFHIESAKKAYSDYLTIRKQLADPEFIKECFNNKKEWPSAEDAFRCLHSFLTHCILICNLLFPINRRIDCIEDEDEKEKIREANKRKTDRKNLLKQYIKQGGPLDPLRAIRNRFEHFDEDLDEWIATTKHTIYMTRNIFDNTTLSKAIKIGDVSTEKLEEEVKPFAYIENSTLKYWGKQYDIEKAYSVLVKLEQEVKQLDLRNRSI
jgi:hypothetical protein